MKDGDRIKDTKSQKEIRMQGMNSKIHNLG